MIKKTLFDDQIEVTISENSDGNMRFFGDCDELEIIKNQRKLSVKASGTARVRTIYDQRSHFTDYYEITKTNLPEYSIDNPEREIPVSDGLFTREPGIGILLPLADCLGAVVFDEKQKIIGLLHAGRHNVEQNGPKKFVEYLVQNFDSAPEDLKIYFSPYALNYRIFSLDKYLGKLAKEQFISAGVLPDNIMDLGIDTVSRENLPSNSSGDHAKRFAIAAKMS